VNLPAVLDFLSGPLLVVLWVLAGIAASVLFALFVAKFIQVGSGRRQK